MGIYLFRVTCTACAFEGMLREGPSGAYYQLPDGDSAVAKAAPAWCTECATVVDAEVLLSLDDARHELAEFERQGPAMQAFLDDAAGFRHPMLLLEHHIAGLQSTLKWRTLRQSPPRCLTCTSHHVAYLPWRIGRENQAMQHPSCPGMLQFAMHAHAVPRARGYSVEGYPLAL